MGRVGLALKGRLLPGPSSVSPQTRISWGGGAGGSQRHGGQVQREAGPPFRFRLPFPEGGGDAGAVGWAGPGCIPVAGGRGERHGCRYLRGRGPGGAPCLLVAPGGGRRGDGARLRCTRCPGRAAAGRPLQAPSPLRSAHRVASGTPLAPGRRPGAAHRREVSGGGGRGDHPRGAQHPKYGVWGQRPPWAPSFPREGLGGGGLGAEPALTARGVTGGGQGRPRFSGPERRAARRPHRPPCSGGRPRCPVGLLTPPPGRAVS